MTDVFAGFRPPCWCPCTWAPAWRLHTNLYKFGENVSSHIFYEKNCCDLNLGESLCICTFFLFPDSGLNLLNGFDFLFWSILNGVTLKTSNTGWRTDHLSTLELEIRSGLSRGICLAPYRRNVTSQNHQCVSYAPCFGIHSTWEKIQFFKPAVMRAFIGGVIYFFK